MWLCLLFLPAESFFQVTAISVEHHSYQVQVQLYHTYDTRLLLSPSHGTAPNVIPGTSQYGVDAAAGHLLLAAVCVCGLSHFRVKPFFLLDTSDDIHYCSCTEQAAAQGS